MKKHLEQQLQALADQAGGKVEFRKKLEGAFSSIPNPLTRKHIDNAKESWEIVLRVIYLDIDTKFFWTKPTIETYATRYLRARVGLGW